MRSSIRSLFFGIAGLLCAGAMAQNPYTVMVSGSITNCYAGQQVLIETTGMTGPYTSQYVSVDTATCTYTYALGIATSGAGVMVSTFCGGNIVTAWDSVNFSFFVDTAYIVLDFTCNAVDCTGIPNGPNVPGSACSDNNPNTINDIWTSVCWCIGTSITQNLLTVSGTVSGCNGPTPIHLTDWWTIPMLDTVIYTDPNCNYSFTYSPSNSMQGWINAEASCDSGSTWMWDSSGYSFSGIAAVQLDFTCGGFIADCTGIPGGPNMPGAPCNDGDPNTINDLWSPNCACIGVVLPPSSVFVTGTVSPCNGGTYPVHIFTDAGTTPPIDTLITTGPNCTYAFLFSPLNTSGWVNVEVSCDSGLTWMWDSLGFTSTPGDTLLIDFTCGGFLTDCTGVPGGPNMPGTACNDGDTLTVQDTWSPSCVCVGVPVNYYDCLGMLNGPDLPGTPCDDGDPATINDTWSANCVCTGAATVPCQADFWVLQGFTVDSLNNPSPIPYELWVWNLSSGGSGTYGFLWNFGDGSSSTDAFPTHTYAGNGPYELCLTIDDGAGCVSTSCDSISIDNNGLYTGIMGGGNDRQNGFTINVQDPLSSGVNEPLDLDGIAAWPNPVVDELNIALTSAVRGTADVTVLDLSGRVVLAERRTLSDGRNQLLLRTTTLSPGLYTVRISNGAASISQRFVKAN